MRANGTTCFWLVILFFLTWCEVSAHAQSVPNCSLPCQSIFATTKESPVLTDNKRFNEVYAPVIERYRIAKQFDTISRIGLVQAPTEMLKFGSSFFPVVGYFVSLGVDKVKNALDDYAKESLADLLRRQLTLRSQKDDPDLSSFTFIYQTNSVAAVDALLGDTIKDITDPEARQVLVEQAVRMLAEQIEAIKKGQRLPTGNVIEMGKQLVDLTNSQDKLLKLSKTSQAAHDEAKLKKLSDTEAPDRSDSPQSQEDGLHDMNLRRTAKMVEIANAAGDQFQALGAIFTRLGHHDLANVANKAAGVSKLVVGLEAAHVNPTAALPAIAGGLSLFGDGADATTAALKKMHQDIIARLDVIEAEIRNNHHEVMAAMEELKRGLIDVLTGVKELLTADIQQCSGLLKDKTYDPLSYVITDLPRTYPKSMQEIERIAAQAGFRTVACLKGINSVFSQPEINSAFLVRRIADNPSIDRRDQVIAFLDAWNQRISSFITAHWRPELILSAVEVWPGFVDIQSRLSAAPLYDADTVTLRLNDVINTIDVGQAIRYCGYVAAVHNWFEWSEGQGGPVKIIKTIGTRSTEGKAALTVAYRILNAAIIQQNLLSGDFILPFLWSMFGGAEEQKEYELFLRDESTFRNKSKKGEAIKQATELLKQNPLLARNYATYYVSRSLGPKPNLLAYHAGLNREDDASLLTPLLSPRHKVEWRTVAGTAKKAWHLHIEDFYVELPAATEVGLADH